MHEINVKIQKKSYNNILITVIQQEKGSGVMAVYLNTNSPLEKFEFLLNSKYYVDKSNIIEKLNEIINTENRYVCITKPRRFGKSSIINGVGFDFKEPQTSEEKRLDVVIVYNNHKYIIELKIWRGDSYYQKGLKQLADYLEDNKQDKGYLLVFDFNEGKQYKREDLVVEGKKIVAVFTQNICINQDKCMK